MEPDTAIIDPAGRRQRLERRLEILGKICRHDLPNQLVVIRGLVNLLMEESSKLGRDGHEYVRRLNGAAERALDMMQALKTLLAIDALADRPEEIDVPDLFRELAKEAKQLFPHGDVEFQYSITVPKVSGIHRPLYKALAELLRHGLAERQDRRLVELGTRVAAGGVEIILAIARDRLLLDQLLNAPPDEQGLENRFDLLVIRELVETWGGAMHFVEITGKGMLVVLLIPGSRQ